MCGLAGYVGTRLAGRDVLSRMSSVIAHRGPDDEGTWYQDEVGLTHRRLSIIDPSPLGHQPMRSSCGRYVIVFNGEIYNYPELRRELSGKGVCFSSKSDTEVLLAAYRHWGRDCLNRLNGMWAFAIWDCVEKRFFASRDRFGKKPFYYTESDGGIYFASEIKALLVTGAVAPRINPSGVADFAAERVSDHTENTFFAGIKQLCPGGWLEWHDRKLRTGRFWTLSLDNTRGRQYGEDKEQILDALTDAVRLRLRADTPVGALLSGGLDSSSVTCLAAGLSGAPVHAFSTLDENPVEEAAGIDQVAERYPNIIVHRDLMSRGGFLADIEPCLWHQEEPFADGSMVAHFRLMRRARQEGIKVLLTGQGADEVFAGYPGYLNVELAGILAAGRLRDFVTKFREIAATSHGASLLSVIAYALPSSLTVWLRRKRSVASIDWLAPDYRGVSPSVGGGFTVRTDGDALNTALLDSIERRTLPGFLHYEDRNSMAHGVETRLPFLDYRLVKMVLPIPADEKTRGGLGKALLRDSVRGVVPQAIINRTTKTGYPAPLARWLRGAGQEVWSDWRTTIRTCPMIKYPRWSHYHKRFMAGDDAALSAVWRGLILCLWHRRFVGNAV